MLCAGLKTTLFLIHCYSESSWPPLFSYSSCVYLQRSISWHLYLMGRTARRNRPVDKVCHVKVKGDVRCLVSDIEGKVPWIFTFQTLHLSVQQLTARHNLIIHISQTTKLNVYICLYDQLAVNILVVWGKGSTHP